MPTNSDYEFQKQVWKEKARKAKIVPHKYTTLSGAPVEMLYTPEDVAHFDFVNDI